MTATAEREQRGRAEGTAAERLGTRSAVATDWIRDVAGAGLAAALSLAVVAMVFHLWSWPPSVPLAYSTDALYYDAVVKGTIDHGWYLDNPDLGAPFGLENHDFPVVSNDSLQLVVVKALGLFTSRPFLVSNLFFLLTFPLNAVGAYVALRWRRVARDLAVLGAAVFGVLPMQFMKGKDYLFFVSFAMVPLGCALVLTVLAGEPLFRRRKATATGLRSLASRRTLLLVVLLAAIASASIYYAVFTSLLLATAALASGVVGRSRRALLDGFAAVAAIGTFVALNQLPTILYRLEHGPNPLVARRDPAETEFYGLRLVQMVLPAPGHRVEPLADLADRYHDTAATIGEPANTAMGLLATIGLTWLLVVGLSSMLASRRRTLGTDEERNAAFVVLVAFLWATAGGLSSIVSYTVTAQLRAWSRMSVYVAFLGILAVLCLIERLRPRLRDRGRLLPALLAGVFLLAALDQTTSRFAPDRDEIERAHAADAGFVRRIEDRMPEGSAILQLPYVSYPEVPPVHHLGAYDELRPYLHSRHLRWSFASMKARPEDWHAAVGDIPLRSLLAGAAAGGFSGLVVDRSGYLDRGTALAAELEAIIGPAAVVDGVERLAFWDLRPLEDRLRRGGRSLDRLSEVTLRPVRLEWGDEFFPEEAQAGRRWRWTGPTGVVRVENPDEEARDVLLSVSVRAGRPGAGSTTLRLPDGSTETVPGDDQGTLVQRVVRVPPGPSAIEVESTAEPVPVPAADRRRLVVQLVDAVVVPVELCEAAVALGAPDQPEGCLQTSRAQRP